MMRKSKEMSKEVHLVNDIIDATKETKSQLNTKVIYERVTGNQS